MRSAGLCRTPSEGGALWSARPTRRSHGSPSLKLRRTGTRDPTRADGTGYRPYRCGDRPGGSQPPVCQRTLLPLQETRKSYHISPPVSSVKRDFLKFRHHSPCQFPAFAHIGSPGGFAPLLQSARRDASPYHSCTYIPSAAHTISSTQ